MNLKIYVASSWRNPCQPAIIEDLRECGYEVYDFRNPGENKNGFSWAEVDPEWERWSAAQYVAALTHPKAEAGFKLDFTAMKWCDVVVLVLPCGRSAHLEAGWAIGAGKPVFILTRTGEEPELMAKLANGIATNTAELSVMLRTLRNTLSTNADLDRKEQAGGFGKW